MTDTRSTPEAPAVPDEVSFGELVRVFGRIGLLSFGGPAGQIALMQRMLVDERRWIDPARFAHALSYCMVLPGPEAQQLATYVGYLLHGTRGGLAAGILFVLPGALVVTALAAAYAAFGASPVSVALFAGLGPAVVALVLEALHRVAGRALSARVHLWVAGLAFVAMALLAVPFPLVVAVAAVVGALRGGTPKQADAAAADSTVARLEARRAATAQRPTAGRTLATALSAAVVWLAPVVAVALSLGLEARLTRVAVLLSQAAVVTFGGAYAVLAFVAEHAVSAGWLSPKAMTDALGLAETTPGPLVLVLTFVAYLAGHGAPGGLAPAAAGLLAAGLSLWVTFVPSMAFIFVGAPHVERLRGDARVAGALSFVTAAVVGAIANLALFFALRVWFGELVEVHLGPFSVERPELASVQPAALALTALSAYLLLVRKAKLPVVLGVAVGLGALAHLLLPR